jgi:hypothetical protein
VVGYDGRPSEQQVERTGAIGREMGDVSKDFDRWIAIELPKINKLLEARGLPRIESARVVP